MKKFKFKSLIASFAALVFAVPMASVPAFANSGPPWEEGVTSTGIHCVHEYSVLEVQNETLTFNIGTPLYELKEGEKYNSTVTAEYTFYNPTADTVNTKMAFPIGVVPYYAKSDEKFEKFENPITVDGQPIEYTIRHTYGTYNSFEEDVKKIKDTYYETDFFKVDLAVTEYVFRVNLEGNDYATLKVGMPKNEGTRYFGNSDSQGNFYYQLYNGDKFSIFVLGNDYDISDLNWSITRYSSLFYRDVQVNGSVTLEKKLEPKTFKNYVLQSYDSRSDVSEVDYYNAMFEIINTDGIYAGSGITPFIGNNFTEWYVYETSVAPGGTFKNAVTATLYPTVYYSTSPYIYEYNYYLSPAREWASFGSLTVNINTTQYMQRGTYYDPDDAENSTFVKTETGYSATFTSLPTTELSMKFCSAQTPSTGVSIDDNAYGLEIIVAYAIIYGVIFVVGPAIGGSIFLIIFLVKRKKRKALAQAEVTPPDQTPAPDQTPQGELPPASDKTEAERVECQAGGEATAVQEVSDQSTAEQHSEQAVEQAITTQNFCTSCGSKLESGVKFCPNCGACVQTEKPVKPVQPVNPQGAPLQESKVNFFGIIGFSLSVSALLLISVWYLSAMLFIPGLGLSITGLVLRKRFNRVNGLAIAGVIIGGIVLFLFICLAVYFMIVWFFLILAWLAFL